MRTAWNGNRLISVCPFMECLECDLGILAFVALGRLFYSVVLLKIAIL